tara:strand:+ start:7410 stop:7592 length:183 start_codon:yes stop_codon:yes gene_type:complete
MEIMKQIEAKIKGFKIIDSCETLEHCFGAKRYIDRYLEKFEDLLGSTELTNTLLIKKDEL